MKSKVAETQSTLQATEGSTSSSVANAQARLQSARAQLLQAQATLDRTQSDSRRTIELAKQGVASDQERVQAETNLAAQQAVVQSLKDQVTAGEADLNTAVANTHQQFYDLPPGAMANQRLASDPAWERMYSDDKAVVFRRR